MTTLQNVTLIDLLERDLLSRYGAPLIGGEELSTALGYPTTEALRQAISRGTVPVPVFAVRHRRGKFALIRDIAAWLAALREGAVAPEQEVAMR